MRSPVGPTDKLNFNQAALALSTSKGHFICNSTVAYYGMSEQRREDYKRSPFRARLRGSLISSCKSLMPVQYQQGYLAGLPGRC